MEKTIEVSVPRRAMPARSAAWCIALSAATLTGCVAYPYPYAYSNNGAPPGPAPSTILSRLPAQPGAGGSGATPGAGPAGGTTVGTVHTLSPAEKRRYDEIDRQVLRDQDQLSAEQAAAAAWVPAYEPPVAVYSGYGYGAYGAYGDGYGGYGYPYGGYGGAYYGW